MMMGEPGGRAHCIFGQLERAPLTTPPWPRVPDTLLPARPLSFPRASPSPSPAPSPPLTPPPARNPQVHYTERVNAELHDLLDKYEAETFQAQSQLEADRLAAEARAQGLQVGGGHRGRAGLAEGGGPVRGPALRCETYHCGSAAVQAPLGRALLRAAPSLCVGGCGVPLPIPYLPPTHPPHTHAHTRTRTHARTITYTHTLTHAHARPHTLAPCRRRWPRPRSVSTRCWRPRTWGTSASGHQGPGVRRGVGGIGGVAGGGEGHGGS